ncbi:MAG: hypothetical protein ACMG55_18000 [Microcoleus sp.]
MRFEHRGWTIDLFLVGIHYPNYPDKNPCEARAVWESSINGDTSSATISGDREEVLKHYEG